MSYDEARRCFRQAAEIIGIPQPGINDNGEVVAWDLHAGLLNLATAIEEDIVELRNGLAHQLDDLRRRLARIETQKQRQDR